MAGLVDTHVHVNEPGRTEWEGYESATRAAALGGVTTLADMPLNSMPVTTTLAAFEQKLAATAGRLWVDVGFWGGVVPGNTPELAPMARAGVRGFKCFLCPSGIDEFPPVGERELLLAMPELKRLGVPLLVHAELELPLREATVGDARDYATYLHSRPPEWENAAVALIIDVVRKTGCPAHIVHLSSAGALPMLRQAKAEGLPVSAETCPHYLCLRAEDVPAGATAYKCAPPIRGSQNQEALWGALAEGVIDFVVTDHSPCIPGLKRLDDGDFLAAWGGIASLQLGLAAVWTEARRRGHDLATVHRWLGAGPAALLGAPRGSLEVGARADLVAFDPDADFVVDPHKLAHKNPITAYAGRRLSGVVRHAWLAGSPLVIDGALVGEPAGEPLLS
jgi:allantoinase